MKIRSIAAPWLLAAALSAPMLTTSMADAQSSKRDSVAHRQKTKNEWRNIAIGSGIVALIGLSEKNGTLTTLGTVGALYAASRYEHDRKSQSKLQRERAALYSRERFTYKGKRYERKTVMKNGKKYYKLVRC
ncbi:MAG: hypothetical protein KF784_10610 [Fimbriimonadaceae bacterium]|nr:hypothetical protein [Fimbriimonadaceae bacterium]